MTENRPASSQVRNPPPMLDVGRDAMDHTCGRWLGRANCDQPATWHFMWDADGENSLTCDAHHDEALRLWGYHDMHPITTVCTMPGADWFFSWDEPPGCCRWVVSEETLAAAESVAEPEVAHA